MIFIEIMKVLKDIKFFHNIMYTKIFILYILYIKKIKILELNKLTFQFCINILYMK